MHLIIPHDSHPRGKSPTDASHAFGGKSECISYVQSRTLQSYACNLIYEDVAVFLHISFTIVAFAAPFPTRSARFGNAIHRLSVRIDASARPYSGSEGSSGVGAESRCQSFRAPSLLTRFPSRFLSRGWMVFVS